MNCFKYIGKISNCLFLSSWLCSCWSDPRSSVFIDKSTEEGLAEIKKELDDLKKNAGLGGKDADSITIVSSEFLPADVSKYREGQRIGLVNEAGDVIQFYKLVAGVWSREGNIQSSGSDIKAEVRAYLASPEGIQFMKSYIDPQLDQKADEIYVDDALNEKADKTYVDDELRKLRDEIGEKIKAVVESNQNFQNLQNKIKSLTDDEKNTITQKYFRDPDSFMKSYNKFKDVLDPKQLYNLIKTMGAEGFIKDYKKLEEVIKLREGDTHLNNEMGRRWFYDESSDNFKYFLGGDGIVRFNVYDRNMKQLSSITW